MPTFNKENVKMGANHGIDKWNYGYLEMDGNIKKPRVSEGLFF